MSTDSTKNTTREKARLCLRIIMERKAMDPVLLEVSELTSLTDYFLIASGDSTRQVQALARHVAGAMRKRGFKIRGLEGQSKGQWVLMDYGDLVVHLFYQPIREFYDLESLWSDAPRLTPDIAGRPERSSGS